jgi:hypothetical protein
MKKDPDRRNVPGAHDQTKALQLRPQYGFVITVVAVGVAFFVAAVILGTNFAPTNGTIEFELLKLIIQFLLIVALGAVVAVGVETVKRRMDSEASQRQYEVDTLTSLLAQLDEIYREVRRERRSLGLQIPMTYKYYNKAMRHLNDRKQDIEHLWRDEMQVFEKWLPAIQGIWRRVKEMEDYLGRMEDEWKDVARAPDERLNAPLPSSRHSWLRHEETIPVSATLVFHTHAVRNILVDSLSTKRTDKQWVNRTRSRPSNSASPWIPWRRGKNRSRVRR